MSADPADAEPIGDPVVSLLQQLEGELLSIIAAGVAEGLTSEQVRVRVLNRVALLVNPISTVFTAALVAAFTVGASTAEADAPAREGKTRPPRRTPPAPNRALRLLTQVIDQAPTRGARMVDVINQQVTDGLVSGVYGTRRDGAADLLMRYAANGITGFRDSAGRQWDLASYAEVVTRTTLAQTLVQSHQDRLSDMGHDLVIVSDSPEECKLCRPFEGKVLSNAGRTPPGRWSIDGHDVTVLCSVAQAKSKGLHHPNCRHRLNLFIPGVTRPMGVTKDPEGDKLRQSQRARERRVREHKRRVIAAEAAFGKQSPEARNARLNLRKYQSSFARWRTANGRKNLSARTSLKVR